MDKLKSFSRVLHPDDYALFDGHKLIRPMMNRLQGQYRYEHEHRKWEYGLAIDFIKSVKDVQTVLDVGGGGSPLAPILADMDYTVTQTDLSNGNEATQIQSKILGVDIQFISADFSEKGLDLGKYDIVLSTSTIEHVPNDEEFFVNLLKHAKKGVFLTLDYSGTRRTFSDNHLRTYNKKDMEQFIKVGYDHGFETRNPNYVYRGNFVYEYTFASLALEK